MADILHPGESIRPQLTETEVEQMILELYGLKVHMFSVHYNTRFDLLQYAMFTNLIERVGIGK